MEFVSSHCEGENCHCGKPAVKKISEVILPDEEQMRHEYTQYVCLEHFERALRPYMFKKQLFPYEDFQELLSSNDFREIIDKALQSKMNNPIYFKLSMMANHLRGKKLLGEL